MRWVLPLLLGAFAFGQENTDDLFEDLVDDDAYVRELARKGLATLGKKVVPHLTAALSSDNPRLRAQAAMTLGAIGKDAAEAAPALEKLRADKDPAVRKAAIAALKTARPEPEAPKNFAQLVAGPSDPLLAALRGPDPLGPAAVAVPLLLRIIETREDALKAAAGKAFSRYGKEGRFATPKLIALGRTAAWPQRFAIADALAAIGPSVCDPLLDAWSGCKAWAPEVCYRLKERVIATAIPALGDPKKQVRAAACDMLGAARSPVGMEQLMKALHDPAGSVRRRAALALGGIGAKEAVPALVMLASDPARRAQREAVVALRQIVLEAAAVHRTSTRLISSKERKAVLRGLDWLIKNQERTGAWDSERHGGGTAYTPGVTGLALLALVEGEPEKEHRASIEAGLRYLIAAQDAEGCFGPRTSQHFLYSHAAATLAMCVAYGQTRNPTYRASAQTALDFVAAARSVSTGGWRYVPAGDQSDTSMTGWMVHAMRRGLLAGLDVDENGFAGALKYLGTATAKNGRIGYLAGTSVSARPTELRKKFPEERTRAMTSAGAFALYQAGSTPSLATVKECLTFLPKWEPDNGQLDMYYWYHCTHLLHHVGGGSLAKWAKPLKTALLKGQAHDGFWNPVGPWGPDGGRVYSTALMALCLKALDGRAQPVRFRTPSATALRPALAVLRHAQRHEDKRISAAAKNALSALK